MKFFKIYLLFYLFIATVTAIRHPGASRFDLSKCTVPPFQDGTYDITTRKLCKNYTPGYYFDIRSSTCQYFIFGGCATTSNFFFFENQCLKTCLHFNREQFLVRQF